MQAKSFTPDAVTSVQFPDPDAASETWFGSRMDHLELPVDALRHLVDGIGCRFLARNNRFIYSNASYFPQYHQVYFNFIFPTDNEDVILTSTRYETLGSLLTDTRYAGVL